MQGFTETITIGGTGGTAKVLNLIKSDGNTAEYYLRESLEEFRVKIQHSSSGSRDRHYVELKNTVYAVSPLTEDTVRQASIVIMAKPSDASAKVTDVVEGLAFFLSATNIPKLLEWQK